MARLDDRLREDLERVARPADPSGLYENLIRRRQRRRFGRRAQAVIVAFAVLAASLWGIRALSRSLEPRPAQAPLTSGMVLFQRYARCEDRPDLSTGGLEVMAVDVATGELRVVSSGEFLRGNSLRSEDWPSVSPDGRSFVWVDHYDHNVFTTDIATGETTRVTSHLVAGPPRFSPDGKSILFQATMEPDGPTRIYTVSPDGSSLAALGPGTDPTWTNDGRVAFIDYESASDGGRMARFIVMNADGSDQEVVFEGAGDVTFGRAEWSPDGTRVVTDATVNGNTDIYVLDLESQTPTRLTSDIAQDTSPTWSPDGDYIAFHTGRWGGTELGHAELAIMRADGSGLQRLTNDCFGDFMPSWVRDDTTLRSLPVWTEPPLPDLGEPAGARAEDILTSTTTDGFYDLFAIDPGTGSLRNLTADTAVQGTPAWSPDRTRIAFASDIGEPGNIDIYVMDRDGTGIRRLTTTPGTEGRPAWSPDGTQIVYEADAAISVVSVDGGEPRFLAEGADAGGSYPTWSVDGRIAFRSRSGISVVNADGSHLHPLIETGPGAAFYSAYETVWSPDGSQLLFTCDSSLCLSDADGGTVEVLSIGAGIDAARSGDWSPDGAQIVFLGYQGQNDPGQLYVMDADGSNVQQLTDAPDGCCHEPDW